MGQGSGDFRLKDPRFCGALPPEVEALSPRMRQIATIVYLSGPVTARGVREKIEDPLTDYGFRMILGGLNNRGIVIRGRSGVHSEMVYLPAILTGQVRELALRRFIAGTFDSSVSIALQTALRLTRPGPPGLDHP